MVTYNTVKFDYSDGMDVYMVLLSISRPSLKLHHNSHYRITAGIVQTNLPSKLNTVLTDTELKTKVNDYSSHTIRNAKLIQCYPSEFPATTTL